MQGYYRLLTVSSHYNTQLGLLSALQSGAKQQTDYLWKKKIPALAAVLVFELHADPNAVAAAAGGKAKDSWGGFAVRAVFQDGPKATYKVRRFIDLSSCLGALGAWQYGRRSRVCARCTP